MKKKISIPDTPLAERIRPKDLSEFYGQENLVGEGKPIFLMIENDTLSSFILWGPPGSGKTTLAKIIAEKISLLLTNEQLRNKIGMAVRETMEKKYSLENYVDNLIIQFKKAMES